MASTDQGGHLLFDADRIRTDPLSKTNHTWLVHHIMVKTGPNVHSHGPNFLVLWITVRVDFGIGIAITASTTVTVTARRTAATGPVNPGHVKVDVVGNLDIWVVAKHPFVGPIVATALPTFFTGP